MYNASSKFDKVGEMRMAVLDVSRVVLSVEYGIGGMRYILKTLQKTKIRLAGLLFFFQ